MSSMSRYLATQILNKTIRNIEYIHPTTLYLALFTSSASASGLNDGDLTGEVIGNGYSRLSKVAADFDPPTDVASPVCRNTADLVWPSASGGDYGLIRYVAVMDSIVGGSDNVLYYGQLSADKNITDGDTFRFLASDFAVFLT